MTESGVILFDKPAGVTSHDVVARVRHELRERTGEKHKVGHAGTLDPFATGLLVVLVGAATRAQRFFVELRKTYRVVARLGWLSTTGDPQGELVETGKVADALEIPLGEQWQRPHAFSAVKLGGERLYKKARRGELVEAPPRKIEVYGAELQRRDGDRAEFLIECSSGTYVRQLVAGLGDAYCEQLERTAIGPFRLADADPERIVPLAEALSFLPGQELDDAEAERASHGVGVTPRDPGDTPVPSPVRLTHGQDVIAIAEPRDGRMKPLVVFPS
ncbi:MAG TPA: tRNA pseudouridine(55) synthase TruB [Thermoleophilaceae bacterium]|nr:tRNA pseudouridine(55) synthase TruB [Thermoleophilaceae bacterium]